MALLPKPTRSLIDPGTNIMGELYKPSAVLKTKHTLVSNFGTPGSIEGSPLVDTSGAFKNFELGKGSSGYAPQIDPELTAFGASDATPKLGGKWMDGAKIGLGAAEVGLGVWNALEQQKMNKFMRGYYGDQMNLQRADFANNAKSTNAALEQRERNRLSAAGYSFDSAENKQGTADAMAKWGVKETF